jgi:hypothetical protein
MAADFPNDKPKVTKQQGAPIARNGRQFSQSAGPRQHAAVTLNEGMSAARAISSRFARPSITETTCQNTPGG